MGIKRPKYSRTISSRGQRGRGKVKEYSDNTERVFHPTLYTADCIVLCRGIVIIFQVLHLFHVECLICFINTVLHGHAVTNSHICKQPNTTTVLFCQPDGNQGLSKGCCGSGCCFLHPQFSSQSGNSNHRHFSHKPASVTSGLPPPLSTSVTDTQFRD